MEFCRRGEFLEKGGVLEKVSTILQWETREALEMTTANSW